MTRPGAKLQRMAENRNDTVVDGPEARMRPKARSSKGMVSRMQASAMATPEAGRRHGICKRYPEWVRKRGRDISRPRTIVSFVCEGQRIIWIKVPFGQDDDEPDGA